MANIVPSDEGGLACSRIAAALIECACVHVANSRMCVCVCVCLCFIRGR